MRACRAVAKRRRAGCPDSRHSSPSPATGGPSGSNPVRKDCAFDLGQFNAGFTGYVKEQHPCRVPPAGRIAPNLNSAAVKRSMTLFTLSINIVDTVLAGAHPDTAPERDCAESQSQQHGKPKPPVNPMAALYAHLAAAGLRHSRAPGKYGNWGAVSGCALLPKAKNCWPLSYGAWRLRQRSNGIRAQGALVPACRLGYCGFRHSTSPLCPCRCWGSA
jgi:hypothetical protein